MNYAAILPAVATLVGLSAVFGLLLSYAAKAFAVDEDPRIGAVVEVLPGANCGACGYAGCSNFAENVVKGEAPISGCVPGGSAAAAKIADILGVDAVAAEEKMVPVVHCIGTKDLAHDRFEYHGVRDCNAALGYGGGEKACEHGCLGYGSCVKACPFDAMHMGANGLPEVDLSRCTGCGACASICPRSVIRMIPQSLSEGLHVLCNSKAKGKDVRKQCDVGCLACKACEKACPRDAIHVENNLAVIDRNKCDDCGACVEKCPRPVILMHGGVKARKKKAG